MTGEAIDDMQRPTMRLAFSSVSNILRQISSNKQHETRRICVSQSPGKFFAQSYAITDIQCNSVSIGITPGWQQSVRLPAYLAFDKVPKGIPDWWDEEDDDDDEDNVNSPFEKRDRFNSKKFDEGGGGEGGDYGGSGGGRGGRSDEPDDGGGGGDDGDGKSNPFAASLAWYTSMLTKFPLRTKTITTSILGMLGDLIAQFSAHENGTPYKHDLSRTVAIGLWGLIFMGPVLHFWYTNLDRAVVGRLSILGKVVADQTLFAPFFTTMFMFGCGVLEGNGLDTTKENWVSKFFPSMKASYMLWPLAQTINFMFVPKHFQVFYVNCVALFWNCVLTYISHDDDIEAPEPVEKIANSKLSPAN